MLDGLYGSLTCFFVPYLLFRNGEFATDSGLSIDDQDRFGVYVGPAAVIVINLYILINTYRWDWLTSLLVAISILLIFFWTGVYSAFISAAYFYKVAPQAFGQATFWAVTFLSVTISLMPRFCIKTIQKVYFPRDIDIIREQVRQGKFAHLDHGNRPGTSSKGSLTALSDIAKQSKHTYYPSVDEDQRPIYPPAATENPPSRNGGNGTESIQDRSSLDLPLPQPSIDRIRVSMDRMRPSYEENNDFTSATMLTRMESSNFFSPVQTRRQNLR